MGDNSGEYVLQWEGHAGHVTERFSGLFARQSLVDVTLICEEQRLRVHRLVLASCSLYFEEMLEQDLGQEPTILLSDLNFEVLKAMVEFMYCGETSVSEEHLEPLLNAARIFKVKELACIAENLMGSQTDVADEYRNCVEFSKDLKEDVDDLEDGNDYSLFSDNDCGQSSMWSKIEVDECSANGLDTENSDTDIENSKESWEGFQVPLSLAELACRNVVKFYTEIPSAVKIYIEKKKNQDNSKTMDEDIDVFRENNELRPVVYEQCFDIVHNEKNSNKYIADNYQPEEARPEEKSLLEFKEVKRTLDKCLKVYTHKRRKSVEGVEKQLAKMIEDLPELPVQCNNCIDLIEEPSRNETELENDYVLNLRNGNVETLVDFVSMVGESSEVYYADTRMNCEKKTRDIEETFSNDNRILKEEEEEGGVRLSDRKIYKSNNNNNDNNSLCVPALRRSVRLSHQENEDSTNNNNNNNNDSIQEVDKAKYLRKESLKRRNNKESDLLYCENELSQNCLKKCLNPPRCLRSNSNRKLIERRGSKVARLSLPKSKNKEEEEGKSRDNNKKLSNIESCESFSNKLNTIATVSRALWGDMSDCLENNENNIDFSDYTQSKEIPFAVGLLPLRDALERMQATPDYQPRKTRSSVTPFIRHEFKSVKRKNLPSNVIESNNFKVKKPSSNSNGDNFNRDTVCHVRITTSHSEAGVKPDRKLVDEQVDNSTISQNGIINRQ